MAITNQNGAPINYPISSGSFHSVNGGGGGAMMSSPTNSTCCLVDNGNRCPRASGNASYSKRIEKQVAQRKLRLQVDPRSTHNYICEHHKQIIQSIRTSGKRKRKDDDGVNDDDLSLNDSFNGINDSSNDFHHHHHHSGKWNSSNEIDLHSLQVNTLRRYKRHFRISTRPGINKNQLAEELNKHFRTIKVNEKEVLSTFMYRIKNNLNKLDCNPKLASNND